MTQYARPISDTLTGNWDPYPSTPTTLFDKVDEVTSDDDSTYIVGDNAATVCALKLGPINTPSLDTGHIVHLLIRSDGSGGPEKIDIRLVEDLGGGGELEIAAWNNQSNRSGSYADKALTVAEAEAATITDYENLHVEITADSIGSGEWMRITQVYMEAPDGLIHHTLNADGGSYQLAGQSLSPLFGRKINIEAAAFQIAGQPITFLRTYILDIGGGSFQIAGQDLDPLFGRKIDIGAGAFQIAGQDLDFARTYILDIGAGTFQIAGQDMTFLRTYILDIGAGAYQIAGQPVTLTYGYTIDAGAGSYQIVGQDVGLLKTSIIDIGAGAYQIAGQPVTLLKTNIINIGEGSYQIAGQDLSPLFGRVIDIGSGVYQIAGQDVDLIYTPITGYTLDAEGGSFLITGQDIGFSRTYVIDMGAGVYQIAGQDIQTLLGRMISAGAGNYVLTGQDLELLKDNIIIIGAGSYEITGKDAILDYEAVAEILCRPLREIVQWIEDNSSWIIGTNLFFGHLPPKTESGTDPPVRCVTVLEVAPGGVEGQLPDRMDKIIQIRTRAQNYSQARADAKELYRLLHGTHGWNLGRYLAMTVDALGTPAPVENPNDEGHFVFAANYLWKIEEEEC